MVRFPGENHELSRSGTPSRRLQRLHLYRKWFGRFLLGESAPEFDEPFERGEAPAPAPAESGDSRGSEVIRARATS